MFFSKVHRGEDDLLKFAIEYYHEELKNVLDTFGLSMEDVMLPSDVNKFFNLIKRGFVLEFVIVTVLR